MYTPIAKYLGMPTQIGHSKQVGFNFTMDRIHKKLKGWKERSMSFAGRGTLISVVIQALPTYIMSCFLLPKNMCDNIEKIMCKFWWGSAERQHKIHWKARKEIFQSKLAGGLGFREMHLFNKAMLAKQVWRLQTDPNSLLGRCLKAKYYPNSDILHAHHSRNSSYAWRSIYQAISLIKKGSCWQVGNGKTTDIWVDNWVIWQNGYKILTPPQGINGVSKVSDLIIEQPTKRWNSTLIDQIFLPFEGTLIKQTPLIMEDTEDLLMWPHTKEGTYTVKSGYNLLKQWHTTERPGSTTYNNTNPTWKKLWSLHTIPRHKALLWRIIQYALPVKSALSKRGIPCNIICPRCLKKEETIDHVFMLCDRSTKIWFGSKIGVKFDSLQISFAEWVKYSINTLKEEDIIYIAAITYGIWFARNQLIFEDRDIEEWDTIDKASKSIQDYQQATKRDSSNQPSNRAGRSNTQRRTSNTMRNLTWNKLEEGTIKVNCDANLTRIGRWGLGAICRDSDGELLAAATWEMSGADDPTLAEAVALYNAVLFAKDCCFRDVTFESDCSEIIELVNKEGGRSRSYVGKIIRGIICNRSVFRACQFKHIKRETNRAAHNLALLAHEEPNRVWLEETPPAIAATLIQDIIH
jgi:hypothetical protein